MAGDGDATPPVEEVVEHGASLLASPEEALDLRRRRQRPAEVGRTLLMGLGAVCAGAASAFWFTSHVALVAVALLVFGLLLAVLGALLHLVLVRDRDRWPERAHAWDEGIELLLHDGELRAASWTDPKLALDLLVHPRGRTSEVERLLVWKMDSAIPPCDLSESGFARLMQVVVDHDLRLSEYRSGRTTREARAYVIRGRTDLGSPGPRSAPSGSSRSAP